MKRFATIFPLIVCFFFLAACAKETPPALASTTPQPPPFRATVSQTPSRTWQPSPTRTSTPRPSPTHTSTPTPSFQYVFPIHPTRFVDFVDGHSGYPATDIFAPAGYEFLAVISGRVDFTCPEDLWLPEVDDPNTRGGISVAIIGDDGLRYYGAHLTALAEGIEPGVRVIVGQVLGYVGHTGNARETPTHVHFAISFPTYPEDWKIRRGQINPYPALVAWQRGENFSPVRLPVPP